MKFNFKKINPKVHQFFIQNVCPGLQGQNLSKKAGELELEDQLIAAKLIEFISLSKLGSFVKLLFMETGFDKDAVFTKLANDQIPLLIIETKGTFKSLYSQIIADKELGSEKFLELCLSWARVPAFCGNPTVKSLFVKAGGKPEDLEALAVVSAPAKASAPAPAPTPAPTPAPAKASAPAPAPAPAPAKASAPTSILTDAEADNLVLLAQKEATRGYPITDFDVNDPQIIAALKRMNLDPVAFSTSLGASQKAPAPASKKAPASAAGRPKAPGQDPVCLSSTNPGPTIIAAEHASALHFDSVSGDSLSAKALQRLSSWSLSSPQASGSLAGQTVAYALLHDYLRVFINNSDDPEFGAVYIETFIQLLFVKTSSQKEIFKCLIPQTIELFTQLNNMPLIVQALNKGQYQQIVDAWPCKSFLSGARKKTGSSQVASQLSQGRAPGVVLKPRPAVGAFFGVEPSAANDAAASSSVPTTAPRP
jgi:hypothetical protein